MCNLCHRHTTHFSVGKTSRTSSTDGTRLRTLSAGVTSQILFLLPMQFSYPSLQRQMFGRSRSGYEKQEVP